MKRIFPILMIVLLVFVGLIALAAHKSLPYFAEVPRDRFEKWRLAPYVPAGHGKDWKLDQYFDDGGPLNGSARYVLQKDGKIYDLVNARDTWGFANATSWKIDLVGDRLYIFDAHQYQEPGWYHLEVKEHDWLLPRLGMAPDGEIRKINPPSIEVPSNLSPGATYKLENGSLHKTKTVNDYDDFFELLNTGDYYLSPPGTGVREVLDLTKTPQRK